MSEPTHNFGRPYHCVEHDKCADGGMDFDCRYALHETPIPSLSWFSRRKRRGRKS